MRAIKKEFHKDQVRLHLFKTFRLWTKDNAQIFIVFLKKNKQDGYDEKKCFRHITKMFIVTVELYWFHICELATSIWSLLMSQEHLFDDIRFRQFLYYNVLIYSGHITIFISQRVYIHLHTIK